MNPTAINMMMGAHRNQYDDPSLYLSQSQPQLSNAETSQYTQQRTEPKPRTGINVTDPHEIIKQNEIYINEEEEAEYDKLHLEGLEPSALEQFKALRRILGSGVCFFLPMKSCNFGSFRNKTTSATYRKQVHCSVPGCNMKCSLFCFTCSVRANEGRAVGVCCGSTGRQCATYHLLQGLQYRNRFKPIHFESAKRIGEMVGVLGMSSAIGTGTNHATSVIGTENNRSSNNPPKNIQSAKKRQKKMHIQSSSREPNSDTEVASDSDSDSNAETEGDLNSDQEVDTKDSLNIENNEDKKNATRKRQFIERVDNTEETQPSRPKKSRKPPPK